MAAADQKKRSVSSSPQEHHKGKKTKLDTFDYELNLSSRTHLEWNDLQKSVVAKRDQVGITWANIVPFLESFPHGQNLKGVADVLTVPEEIFHMNNLMDVLSYEAWTTCLSESERKLLTQFLPGGSRHEQTVHSLLSGENHHFGNPSLQWSTSLCSGNLHPHCVLKKERQIRSTKRQYCSELNKYHTDMLAGLMKWKEKCSSCKDPEKLWSKGVTKHKQRDCTEKNKFSFVPQKEASNRIYIRNGDIAKHMSYIKISKKQHEVITNLKNSGDGIQRKSLNHVLGDIRGFQALPLEALLEEEKLRLHTHWLQLVKKDLPVAFEAYQKQKLNRNQVKKCLEQEFFEKRTPVFNEVETDIQETSPCLQVEEEPEYQAVETTIEEDIASSPAAFSHYHHMTHDPFLKICQEQRSTAPDQVVVGSDSLSSASYSPVIPQITGSIDLVECGRVPSAPPILPPNNTWRTLDSNGSKFSNDLSQRQSFPTEVHRAPMLQIERSIMGQEAVESADMSLFSSYATPCGNSLLEPFPMGTEMLPSYAPQGNMNQLGLQFPMASNHLSALPQFPHPIQQQQSLVDHSMNPMMDKNIYTNGRHPTPEMYLNDNSAAHNWFSADLQTRSDCWSGIVPSNSGAQILGGNTDGGLFNMLSGCRNLPSRSVQDSIGFMGSRNFVPNNERVYNLGPQSSSLEPAPSSLNIPRMNLPPHHISSIQDSVAKPQMRYWKQ